MRNMVPTESEFSDHAADTAFSVSYLEMRIWTWDDRIGRISSPVFYLHMVFGEYLGDIMGVFDGFVSIFVQGHKWEWVWEIECEMCVTFMILDHLLWYLRFRYLYYYQVRKGIQHEDVEDSKGTSQMCSNCQAIVKKGSLCQGTYCPHCGYREDRMSTQRGTCSPVHYPSYNKVNGADRPPFLISNRKNGRARTHPLTGTCTRDGTESDR